MSWQEPFGQRLGRAMREHGPLCVGIDPHPGLLASWELPDDATGVRTFGLRCVEAFAGLVAAVKPQAAFFERFGSAGVAALEDVIAACRAAGLLCIVDAKRGDIGSTMSAYARAYLADGSPLAGDAVTLSPYLGFGSLNPALKEATASGRGVFVLCLTSNPEGAGVQHARTADGRTVAAAIAAAAGEHNRAEVARHLPAGGEPAGAMGSVGLVIGATVGTAVSDMEIDLAHTAAPLLAPGFGAQGAGPAHLRQVFGAASAHVLVSSSRGVLACGPDVLGLRDAARATLDSLSIDR